MGWVLGENVRAGRAVTGGPSQLLRGWDSRALPCVGVGGSHVLFAAPLLKEMGRGWVSASARHQENARLHISAFCQCSCLLLLPLLNCYAALPGKGSGWLTVRQQEDGAENTDKGTCVVIRGREQELLPNSSWRLASDAGKQEGLDARA